MEDLLWMRANGLEAAVLKEAAKGKIIFGICGGYQMLGETLSDPHHVEAGGTIKGMGLLPMDTVFAEKKTRTRVSGRFLELEGELQALSGTELEGYEIHMGETVLKGEAGHSVSIEDQVSGECKEDGAYCKMSAEPMSMEFLTGKMWQRLLYVFWVRKRESMYLR